MVFFFINIKISKNLSAKYYQENKERLQKEARGRCKNIKIFLKKKKKKNNMVLNVTKIKKVKVINQKSYIKMDKKM